MISSSDKCEIGKVGLCEGCAERGDTSFEWLESIYEEEIFDLNSELKEQTVGRSVVKGILGKGNSWASPSAVKGLGLGEDWKECQCKLHKELK